ncbi:MAG: ATP-binding protein [Aggregatilineaceae bacterium]
MRHRLNFQKPLIQRLFFLFLVIGLIPTLLLAAAPTFYIMIHGPEALGETLLLMWVAQGGSFLIIVLIGAGVTLRRLAIPIQELANGAKALASGNLSYRVPLRGGDQELVRLTEAFNAMAEAIETMRNDIAQQHQALQTSLVEREREFDAMVQVASLANSQADLYSTAKSALKIIQGVLQTDIISLVLFDDVGQIATIVPMCKQCPEEASAHCEQCQREQLLRQCFHMMQTNVFRLAIQRQGRVCIDDVYGEDAGLELPVVEVLKRLGIRKLSIRPLQTHGHVLGMLILMRPQLKEIPTRTSILVQALSENIAVLLENRQLQSKSRTLTIMEERRRLASELHDSITQSLFTLSLTACGLRATLANKAGIDLHPLDLLVEQTKVIQIEMRTLINELRPVDLDAGNLDSALRQHAQSLRRSAGTRVKVSIQGNTRCLPLVVQQNLNRIAQEALSNIARHAKAPNAEINLEVRDQMVTLTIRDDGVGFDPHAVARQPTGSLGLTSMRERAEMLGGALLVRSQPGGPTSIDVRIPLAAQASEAYA